VVSICQCLHDDNVTFDRFNDTGHWFPFLNLNFFLQSLWDADERSRIQPSFVLAGLAMATLMKSSETELASSGRNRALWLRDAAQAALESAWNSDWIDATLAEAALVSFVISCQYLVTVLKSYYFRY